MTDAQGATANATAPQPLEQTGLLTKLQAHWQAARAGGGRLVFVEGEAGIGKTTLLKAFRQAVHNEAPVYAGACDALRTPQPLAALDEIATVAGPALQALTRSGTDRHRLFVAFVDLMAERPSLAVLEDLHWADDATLDLLRYAGRRMHRTRSLLVASFRSDELVPAHPLRAVLGDLATSGAQRLAVQPLSLAAVRSLCQGTPVDADDLHRRAGGNPFFVTEVLAAGTAGHDVPATVQDAVLARANRLSPAAREVLDAAAVAGPRVEAWLLQRLVSNDEIAIDECLATGVLNADHEALGFRHELARQAVLKALTPTRAAGLHGLVLQALQTAPAARAAAARLALHAEGAGEAAAVRRWASAAAHEAATRGAHRQAAEHLLRALEYTGPGVDRARLLDEYAVEVQTSGGLAQAIDARQQAAQQWRLLGRSGDAAASLARLALLHVLAARNAEGERTLREAQWLIAPDDTTPAAFAVRRCWAGMRMLDRDCDEAIALATPALHEAERTADTASIIDGLMMIGAAMLVSNRVDRGIEQMERGLALAQGQHRDRAVGQMLANLGSGCGEALRLPLAESYLRRGIQFSAERDLDSPRLYQTAWLSLVLLMRGRWDEAASAAQDVIGDGRAATVARIMALIAAGKLRARRGEPGVWTLLDEARDLALATGSVQRLAPMHAARAEAAWLEGRYHQGAAEAEAGLPLALEKQQGHLTAELLLWSQLCGANTAIPAFCARHPFAVEAAGDWKVAAQRWRTLDCPFDAARAAANGDDLPAQRQALATFESLGARRLAERLRQRLRAAGVRSLPRGPRASTLENAAGLTNKEVKVLVLLASGLRNKEIAARLSRSARTIEHHLQGIFAKLGVATRAEAVSAAYRLGVVDAGTIPTNTVPP